MFGIEPTLKGIFSFSCDLSGTDSQGYMATLLVADEDDSEEDEELEPAPSAVALKTNGDVPGRVLKLLYWKHIYTKTVVCLKTLELMQMHIFVMNGY